MQWRQAIAIAAEAGAGTVRALLAVLAWCIVGCFIAVTAISILWKMSPSPLPELDGAAAALPSKLYTDMLGMEMPRSAQSRRNEAPSPLSARNVAVFLTKLTTGVDPNDPRTLAARVLPGEQGAHSVMLIQGIGTGPADYPVEVPPAPHLQLPPRMNAAEGAREASDGLWLETADASGSAGSAESAGSGDEEGSADWPSSGDSGGSGDSGDSGSSEGSVGSGGSEGSGEHAGPVPSQPPGSELVEAPGEAQGGDAGREPKQPVVFIYHSHPEESFLPELPGVEKLDEAFDPNDPNKTVVALGKRLSEALTARGIETAHSDAYYPWRGAYNESRKTVKAAMATHESLTYFFDIHRDAARAEKTRLVHEGQSYARLFFVVGHKNPDYERNQALAEELHYRIEAKVKGLSRGVVGKKNGSNGEFNQSLSPNSLLIEFGGVDNTLEECFRTAEVLAEVLAELHWERSDALPVDAAPMAPHTSAAEALPNASIPVARTQPAAAPVAEPAGNAAKYPETGDV